MARFTINLDEENTSWIERNAKAQGVSVEEYSNRLHAEERRRQEGLESVEWFVSEHGPFPQHVVEEVDREFEQFFVGNQPSVTQNEKAYSKTGS